MNLFKKTKPKDIETLAEDKKINNGKIEIQEDTKTIFEKNRKTLKDLIAPEYIDFAGDPKYISVGDRYFVKNMYVGLLPNAVNFSSFLHGLYNFGNIDTSIYVCPIDNETAKAELTKQRTNLEVEFIDNGGSSNRADDMLNLVHEAKRLRTEIRDGVNKLYDVSIISSLYEESLRDLNNNTSVLKELLGQQDIGLKSTIEVQEEAFRSNKPLNDNIFGEWHTFDKRSLACTFPFTSNNINHPNGVLIGFNMDNGLPIFYDQFYDKLDNYNMVIFAKSGGGKSTFVKSLAARGSTLDTIQNISIDIEPEYIDICETLGGVNIVISSVSDTIINPFDVKPDIVKNKVTGKQEEVILLSTKINSVTSLLLTMAKGHLENGYYFNDITRMIIKDAVKGIYEKFKINRNPDSLYDYNESKIVDGKIVGGKVKKNMPTISDWYVYIENESKKNDNKTYQPYYDYLLKVMADYTKIKEGGFTCFDGQSTVELSYDIPFINFDVSALNEQTELPLAQHIICDYIWEQMVKRNNTSRKIRVIIDEAWRMVGYPEAISFLKTMFRRARKKNTSTCIISQQFDEFYSEETKSIIKNADTKVFLPPDETSVDEIKEVFKLNEGEAEFLNSCTRGECLIKVNNVSAKLSVEIPPLEKAFIETNQNKKAQNQKVGA